MFLVVFAEDCLDDMTVIENHSSVYKKQHWRN